VWSITNAQTDFRFDRYHTPEEINSFLNAVQKSNPGTTKIHLIGKSWSGIPVRMIEIGRETKLSEKSNPAVFIAANFEGSNPLASEGAVFLIKDLLEDPEQTERITWYVLPLGNPEAAHSFFDSPTQLNSRNWRPGNDDLDDQVDEDPAEDLNGDGYLTQMRYKDPDGTYIIDTADSRRLKRAEASKGEKGIYKIISEGLDNDDDGNYNEDGKGGTNNGISFPHLFKYANAESGRWPGEEDEVFGVLKFMTDHPEIALVMHYGNSNFCLVPPKSGRKGKTNLNSLRIPRRYASMLNADPNKTYTMSEVKEMVKAMVPPGTQVDDSMVAGMLGLGAAVNPQAKDLKFYNEYAKEYKAYLKEKGLSLDRIDPTPAKDGSFELWVYYHLGLPSFSQDFWGIPVFKKENPDSTKTAKSDKQTKPTTQKTSSKKPDKEKAFFAYNDSVLNGEGFVDWKPFSHPQLGEVEIGGILPYKDKVPLEAEINKLLETQVPWIYELVKGIPDLKIENDRITDVGESIYRVEAWIRNTGKMHFPIAMGTRNGNPPPAIISLEGKGLELLEGKKRTVLTGLDAGNQRKITWLIRSTVTDVLTIEVKPVNAIGSVKNIQLGGNK